MPDLNPDQFFHGTTHPIKDGMVRPADSVDKNVSEYSMGDPGDMSQGDHAFVSKSETYAWHAARTFHPSIRRARVYETGPAPDMQPGPWNKDHPDFLAHHDLDDADIGYPPHPDDVAEAYRQSQPEYASKVGFPIRRRIDIMPNHQGTFPDLTWKKFHGPNMLRGQDANHPTDTQARYGMRGLDETLKIAHQENDLLNRKNAPQAKGDLLREAMGRPKKDPQGTLF